jgi:hypothetical protein
MPNKTPANAGKKWTQAQDNKLQQMANSGSSTPAIANALERTIPAVYNRASDKNISLDPPDKPSKKG